MVYRASDSVTFSEIEFSQPPFSFNQFRKLHIFQYCHIANVIIPEEYSTFKNGKPAGLSTGPGLYEIDINKWFINQFFRPF
jgi:hypothetical protein